MDNAYVVLDNSMVEDCEALAVLSIEPGTVFHQSSECVSEFLVLESVMPHIVDQDCALVIVSILLQGCLSGSC